MSGGTVPAIALCHASSAASRPVRRSSWSHAALPSGTLKVKGETVCASVRGIPFEPCFNLNKTNEQSFRGSVSGLGFAYCDFTRRGSPAAVRTSTWRARPSQPLPLESATVAAQATE